MQESTSGEGAASGVESLGVTLSVPLLEKPPGLSFPSVKLGQTL